MRRDRPTRRRNHRVPETVREDSMSPRHTGRAFRGPFRQGLRAFSALHIAAYRLSGGRVGGWLTPTAPVLLLTTRGRRSGQNRITPLIYLVDGADVVIVGSLGQRPGLVAQPASVPGGARPGGRAALDRARDRGDRRGAGPPLGATRHHVPALRQLCARHLAPDPGRRAPSTRKVDGTHPASRRSHHRARSPVQRRFPPPQARDKVWSGPMR